MHLNAFIAKRYLFSKKRQNAVNIISLIAIIGMAIGTAALIIVMSVFNGIDAVIKSSEAPLTPAITIYPGSGKFIDSDSLLLDKLSKLPNVQHAHSVIQESAVMKFKGEIRPVTLKGVTTSYIENCNLANKLVAGGAYFESPEGKKSIIAGYGVAADLSLEFRKDNPILLYYPNKNSTSLSLSSLSTIDCTLAGVFSFSQVQDDNVVFANIEDVQKLLKVQGKETKIELFANEESIEDLKKQITQIIGSDRIIKDKFEENSSFYAMMQSEKLAIFLIMLFVILIASFNIIASISMLMLDKKEDSLTYQSIGLDSSSIKKIFHIQGLYVIVIGIVSGLILGCGISLIQEHFGLIKLGDGNYVTSAYPVDLQTKDIIIILAAVCVIGYTATSIPIHYLTKKWFTRQ